MDLKNLHNEALQQYISYKLARFYTVDELNPHSG